MTTKTVSYPLSEKGLRAAVASLRHVTIDDTKLDAIVYVDERALFMINRPVTITHTLTNPARRTPEGNVWVPVVPSTDTGRRTRVRVYDLEGMTYAEEPLEQNLLLEPSRAFTASESEIDAFIASTYGTFAKYVEPQPHRKKPSI